MALQSSVVLQLEVLVPVLPDITVNTKKSLCAIVKIIIIGGKKVQASVLETSLSKAIRRTKDPKKLLPCPHCRGCSLAVSYSAKNLALASPAIAARWPCSLAFCSGYSYVAKDCLARWILPYFFLL